MRPLPWRPGGRLIKLPALILLFCAATLAGASAQNRSRLVVCDDVHDPLTLDPHKEFSEKNHTIVQQIYEGLVRFDPEGRIEPALAVSWERRDPLRMRFKLRPGVKFHDGEPFTSKAVKFSIERYLDPKTGFPALGFISSLDRVEIVDDHTVDVVTKFPDGLLLNRLAGFVLIVPPGAVRSRGDEVLSRSPVGTGPFRFEGWDRGSRILLAANTDYWMKGYPKVDELEFKFLPEAEQLKALFSGGVDLVTELPGTATTAVVEGKRLGVTKVPTFYAVIGSFNLTHGPLSSKLVREAINLAVDRETLVRYDVMGNGRALATVTMPGEEGHDAELQPYPFDPAKAKKLLEQAGYPQGFHLQVLCKMQGERPFRIVSKQLEAVGVRLDGRFFSDADMMAAVSSQNWDMVFGGCPDPMAHSFFIQSIFLYSKSPYSIVKNPEYDRRLEEMASTIDPEERARRAQELDRRLYDEFLILPGYQRIKTFGYRKGVTVKPYVTGMPYFFSASAEAPR